MKLIVISTSKSIPNESKLINELMESGVETFHLRKPTMSTAEMQKFIESVPAHFHNRIVIHSHHKLASKYSLRGIHLTSIHRKRKFSTWLRIRLLKFKLSDLVISTSFHKVGQVYSNHSEFSYALLGTIFDRLSGRYHSGFSEHILRSALERSSVPLIARGGVSIENIKQCHDLGFRGVCLASSLWDQPNPTEAWVKTLRECAEEQISTT